jgi:hypothetical protein
MIIKPDHKIISSEDLAYIAGIVDGEGCIHIVKRNPTYRCKSYSYNVLLNISNTDDDVLNWITTLIGVGNVNKINMENKPKYRKQMYQYQVASTRAIYFLKLILPYLHIKKEQALLAIEFNLTHADKKGRKGKSKEHFIQQEMYYTKMRKLKRGKTDATRLLD